MPFCGESWHRDLSEPKQVSIRGMTIRNFLSFGRSLERGSSVARAHRDIIAGILMWRSWTSIAIHDIRRRYQRSIIGPFWITISMGATILGLSLVFSALFALDIKIYMPYLAVGIAVWGFISGTANEAASTFINAQQIIMSFTYPFTAHIYRMVLRNFLIFLHNAAAVLVFLVVLDFEVGWVALLSLVGLAALLPILCFASMIVAVLGTRYRDVQQIVSTGMTLAFFLTPIFWRESRIAGRKYWVDWNPFYHFIEIVRAPMLGTMPETRSYVFVAVASVATAAVAYIVFRATRRRITYWI